eukprot:g2372.t1
MFFSNWADNHSGAGNVFNEDYELYGSVDNAVTRTHKFVQCTTPCASWIEVFSEGAGAAIGPVYDNSDESTLNFESKLPLWVAGGNYWVKLEYNGSKTQFLVPSGHNIFRQDFDDSDNTTVDNIPITHVTSDFNLIGSTATFCHACAKNGTRWGRSCWGIVQEDDNKRQCGCAGGSHEARGAGIYYGGYHNHQRVPMPGGEGVDICSPLVDGFAGDALPVTSMSAIADGIVLPIREMGEQPGD